MEPIRTLADYLGYKSILADVEGMIRYYARYNDDVHNDTWTSAKRRLLKTKYQSLYIGGGRKISIDSASVQKINMAFTNSFSKKGEGIDVPKYLETVTKPWYESRINNYEAGLESILPEAGTATLDTLLTAEQVAKIKHNGERAETLHQAIEQKLSGLSSIQLKEIWNSYRTQSSVQVRLMEYDAFKTHLRS